MSGSIRIGILGGGQLAQMMILQGHRLGFSMHVLCGENEPARQVTTNWFEGTPHHLDDVLRFAEQIDILTVESEFFSAEILRTVEKKIPVFPSSLNLAQLQDRLPQKELLKKYKIPTADFLSDALTSEDTILNSNTKNFERILAQASKQWKKFVIKRRQGGYDGYGTWIIKNPSELEKFKKEIGENSFIIEEFIPFKRELACQFVRSKKGHTLAFPLVETFQVDKRLDWLKGPIKHKDWAAFQKKIIKMLKQINYVGVIAFELFDSSKGLIVNEIAPRVHNSGHHSQNSLNLDQFSAHLLAGTNQLPKKMTVLSDFATVNLIGTGQEKIQLPRTLNAFLHWYGKNESRKGRKMGHLNLLGKNSTILVKDLKKLRKGIKI